MKNKTRTFPTEVEFWESGWMAKKRSFEQLLEVVSKAVRTQYVKEALPRKGVIIDAGCGDGKWVFYLVGHGYMVVGADYAIDTLRRNQQLSMANDATCLFLGADIAHLPLSSSSVNGYLSIGLWEHFRSEEQKCLATEAYRVLRPNGIIVVDVPNLYSPWTITRTTRHFIRRRLGEYSIWQRNVSRGALARLCESTGFETIRCINCDVRSSVKRAFYLDVPLIKNRFPNPFYPLRGLLLSVANHLEHAFPLIGYDTIYVGRKVE